MPRDFKAVTCNGRATPARPPMGGRVCILGPFPGNSRAGTGWGWGESGWGQEGLTYQGAPRRSETLRPPAGCDPHALEAAHPPLLNRLVNPTSDRDVSPASTLARRSPAGGGGGGRRRAAGNRTARTRVARIRGGLG